MIAQRQMRIAASGSVLLAFIGLWVGHTLEYLRVWGTAGLAGSLTNPVHVYMLPLAAALAVLGGLFAMRIVRGWLALNRRLDRALLGLRRMWRGHSATEVGVTAQRSSPATRLAALWLPLAAGQILLYVVQENIEAIAVGHAAPGLGPITGIHWAAPFVHLYVALLLACGTRICQLLLHRRSVVVERVEAFLRAVVRRRHVRPSPVAIPVAVDTLSLFDRLGRDLWRRPPPLLLDF